MKQQLDQIRARLTKDHVVRNITNCEEVGAEFDRLIRALEKAVEQRDAYAERYCEDHECLPYSKSAKITDNAEITAILEGK